MAMNLKVTPITNTETNSNQVSLVQNGDNATQIAHVGNYNDTSTNLIINNLNQPTMPPIARVFNREYYNLFVVGDEEFPGSGSFIIPKDKALTKNVADDIKDSINELLPENIEQIKTYPAIFANKNSVFGQSDNEQLAYYGSITEIKVQSHGVKISYYLLNGINQKILNEVKSELGIKGHESFNELDETNWSIKKIDLIHELKNAGIILYS